MTYARPFRLHHTGGVSHGAVFPSGHAIILDDPQYGFASTADTLDMLLLGYHRSRIEWPDTEHAEQRAAQAEAALVRVQHVAALIHAGAPWTANRADTAARIRAAIAGPGTATAEETVPRALFDENARRHQAAVDRVDELLAAIERVRKVATAIRDATAAGRNDWQIGQHDCALTILAALTEPAPAATGATGHRYLSTGCLHGEHSYCSNVDGIVGLKKPAQCKFCQAPCICDCHTSPTDLGPPPGPGTVVPGVAPRDAELVACPSCLGAPPIPAADLDAHNTRHHPHHQEQP